MKLTILGSGSSIPEKNRGCAGYLVTIRNKNYLFDSGAGTIRRLGEANVELGDVHHLFYTHLHLDHVADLFPILFANKNIFRNQQRPPIHLYGPKGFRNFYLTMAQSVENQVLSENYRIYLRELDSEGVVFPDWKLTTCSVVHSEQSLAYRIDEFTGASLVYSGDTDVSTNLVKLAYHCDLLILDCAFPEGCKVEGHLVPSEAGMLASEAGCKKVVLTHFYPSVNEEEVKAVCKKYFSGEVIIAQDLLEIEI